MHYKKCTKCNLIKPTDEFYTHNKRGYQAHCKKCSLNARREYYLKNKDSCISSVKRAKKKLKDRINKIKSNTPCADCGHKYPYYVMDFDHVFGNKTKSVAELVHCGSLRKVMEEIKKCELVCSNCHRIRTYKRML